MRTRGDNPIPEADAPIVPAIIQSVQTSGSPVNGGYSSDQVTYTVKILTESGGSSVATGVVPHNNRPPNTVNITPCPVNSLILGVRIGLNLVFYIVEYPVMSTCP